LYNQLIVSQKGGDWTGERAHAARVALREVVVQNKRLIQASLLLASSVINLHTTIVNVAPPTLIGELHATTSQLQWIVDAYNLVFATLVLSAGSVFDWIARKGVLLAASECSRWRASPAAWVARRGS
jgi:hypothetical protein